MTEDDQEIDRELRTRLRQAALSAARVARHDEIRAEALAAFDAAPHVSIWKLQASHIIHKGVRIMTHPYSRVVMTAAAVLIVALWWAMPHRSIALADFLAPIVNAKTAKFNCTVHSDVPGGNATAIGYFRTGADPTRVHRARTDGLDCRLRTRSYVVADAE